MSKIVLIAGRKKSGKDTLGSFACEQLKKEGYEVGIYHFADPLKRFCIDYLYLPENLVYGTDDDKETLTQYTWESMPNKEALRRKYAYDRTEHGVCTYTAALKEFDDSHKGFMSIRQVLQEVGTGWFRTLEHNYWVNRTIKLIEQDSPDIAIVCDTRFENEIVLPRNHFGKENVFAVRLTRNSGKNDNHPSETALDNYKDFDYVLDNKEQRLETSEDCFALLLKGWL